MKIKRIIFSDVDGIICFFLDKRENLEIRKSILEVVENDNIIFVLNIGNLLFLKMFKMVYELKVKYIIAVNGLVIFDIESKEYLYELELSFDIVFVVLDIIKKYDEFVCFFGKNGYYMVISN